MTKIIELTGLKPGKYYSTSRDRDAANGVVRNKEARDTDYLRVPPGVDVLSNINGLPTHRNEGLVKETYASFHALIHAAIEQGLGVDYVVEDG